jgi:hypothetical protein
VSAKKIISSSKKKLLERRTSYSKLPSQSTSDEIKVYENVNEHRKKMSERREKEKN